MALIIDKMKLKTIKIIKMAIGILLVPPLILLLLILALLQKIDLDIETYENEMKEWHDNDFEGWLAFQMSRQQIM